MTLFMFKTLPIKTKIKYIILLVILFVPLTLSILWEQFKYKRFCKKCVIERKSK